MRGGVASALAVVFLSFTASAGASPGDLDRSFSEDGRFVAAGPSAGHSITGLPDGDVVIAGGDAGGPELLRLNEDGSQDSGFSGDATEALGPSAVIRELAVTSDGTIIAGGEIGNDDETDLLFAAYDAHGQSIGSFASSGVQRIDLGGSEEFGDMALDLEGRIVAFADGPGAVDERIVLRLTPDGHLDLSFAGDGKLSVPGYRGLSLAVGHGNSIYVGRSIPTDAGDSAVVTELDEDGQPAPGFGSRGTVAFDVPGMGFTYVQSLELTRTDALVVNALRCAPSQGRCPNSAARLTPDGQLDATFGQGGWATGLPGGATALASDGDLLVADNGAPAPRYVPSLAVARLTQQGQMEADFGDSGEAFALFGLNWARIGFPPIVQPTGMAQDVAVGKQGEVVLVGTALIDDTPHMVAARFEAAGTGSNADGDRLDDERDRCPYLAGHRRGCPLVERHLSAGVQAEGRLVGRLFADIPACLFHERLRIYRLEDDGPQPEARPLVRPSTPHWIRRSGRWTARERLGPGRFRVTARGHLDRQLGYCAPARIEFQVRPAKRPESTERRLADAWR